MQKMVVTIAIILSVSLTWADEPSQPESQSNPQAGELYGRVSDKATHQPLPGASVLVEGSRLGASTDTEGVFRIERVPVGSHNLRFMMIGYETLVKSNVVVNPGRETWVEAELREVALEMEAIQVRASFFEKARDAVVTTRTMDFEEIRQDPGSSEDIQRVMQALPAVVSGSDQMNEIIVRGGWTAFRRSGGTPFFSIKPDRRIGTSFAGLLGSEMNRPLSREEPIRGGFFLGEKGAK